MSQAKKYNPISCSSSVKSSAKILYQAADKLAAQRPAQRRAKLEHIRKTAGLIRRGLTRRIREEELKILPYLSRHVPRFDQLIGAIESEHARLKALLVQIEGLARRSMTHPTASDEALKESVYLFAGLLERHRRAEEQVLSPAALYYLHEDEKRAIGLAG